MSRLSHLYRDRHRFWITEASFAFVEEKLCLTRRQRKAALKASRDGVRMRGKPKAVENRLRDRFWRILTAKLEMRDRMRRTMLETALFGEGTFTLHRYDDVFFEGVEWLNDQ